MESCSCRYIYIGFAAAGGVLKTDECPIHRPLTQRIEQLEKESTQRGARMQIMREWMISADRHPHGDANWKWFTEDYPEAEDWFDKDGRAK